MRLIARSFLHGDLWLKEKALPHMAAPVINPCRYRPDDKLPAFLEAL